MTATRFLPSKDRPGKLGWLGPVALTLSVLSWFIPLVGEFVAAAAIVCGVASMLIERQYRIDWTAALGSGIAAGQLFFALFLAAMKAAGH